MFYHSVNERENKEYITFALDMSVDMYVTHSNIHSEV